MYVWDQGRRLPGYFREMHKKPEHDDSMALPLPVENFIKDQRIERAKTGLKFNLIHIYTLKINEIMKILFKSSPYPLRNCRL